MSQLSYTGGGSFATSRRGGYDSAAIAQAKDMIQRLGSYQAAAQATGVPVTVLRETFPNVRRSEFRPSSLMRDPVSEAKEVPLPPKVFIDNEQIARIVMLTISQRMRLKLSDLKVGRTGGTVVKLARMLFLENIMYFTSWNIDKVADFCGYKSTYHLPLVLERLESRLAKQPDDKVTADLIKKRISDRIVAIVGG